MRNPIMLFLSIFILLCAFLSSCDSKEEESLQKSISSSRSSFQLQTYDVSPSNEIEKIELLNRLDSVNSSIQHQVSATPQMQKFSWSELEIAGDDARGFIDGCRFGWAHGRGFSGKLLTASICGALFSVAYSAISAIVHTFCESSPNIIPIKEIEISFANVWIDPLTDVKLSQFKIDNPDLCTTSTDEELKLALVHNLVLQSFDESILQPQGNLTKVFSQSQLNFFSSNLTESYNSSVTSIVLYNMSIDYYVPPTAMSFERQIFEKYLEGIHPLENLSYSEGLSSASNLCIAYINEIKDSNLISEDSRSQLISSFYLPPVSMQYWHNHIDNSIVITK